jgi:hypothetical protein
MRSRDTRLLQETGSGSEAEQNLSTGLHLARVTFRLPSFQRSSEGLSMTYC